MPPVAFRQEVDRIPFLVAVSLLAIDLRPMKESCDGIRDHSCFADGRRRGVKDLDLGPAPGLELERVALCVPSWRNLGPCHRRLAHSLVSHHGRYRRLNERHRIC